MRRWFAQVVVEGADPAALSQLLTELEVTEIEGNAVITAASWDAISSPHEIFESSEEAVESAVLGSSVMSISPLKARVTGTVWENVGAFELRRHFKLIAGTGDIFLDPVRAGDRRPFGDRMRDLLRTYPEAEPALHVFATCGSDVRALWLAFEVVKQLAGGEKELVALGWTAKAELNQFMTTANKLHRHHSLDATSRKLSNPLSPNACRSYVRGLLERLLDREVPA